MKQSVVYHTVFESHDVHCIQAVDEGQSEVEPGVIVLSNGLELVLAPRILLVCGPGMLEC